MKQCARAFDVSNGLLCRLDQYALLCLDGAGWWCHYGGDQIVNIFIEFARWYSIVRVSNSCWTKRVKLWMQCGQVKEESLETRDANALPLAKTWDLKA